RVRALAFADVEQDHAFAVVARVRAHLRTGIPHGGDVGNADAAHGINPDVKNVSQGGGRAPGGQEQPVFADGQVARGNVRDAALHGSRYLHGADAERFKL